MLPGTAVPPAQTEPPTAEADADAAAAAGTNAKVKVPDVSPEGKCNACNGTVKENDGGHATWCDPGSRHFVLKWKRLMVEKKDKKLEDLQVTASLFER